MIHAADVREWRNRDVVDAESHKIGVLEAIYAIVGPGYVSQGRLCQNAGEAGPFDRHRRRVPAEQEEAVFKHYGLPYRSGAAGERQLARR